MRAKEFLLEYDRSREQQRIEALPAYTERLRQDPSFSLEKLESADPTPQKSYVPRLAVWWLAGEPVEDLISTTADALEKYHTLKIKKQLKPEHTDIGKFKTADQFITITDQYQLPSEESTEERGKYKQVYRDNDLIVVELFDKAAAMWWGKNTKWCTAATNNNQFDNYNNQGPLYVIIDRKANTRYQLWWQREKPNNIQFMNELDRPVQNIEQLELWPRLQQIFKPLHPSIMWNTNPTEEEQIEAVQQHVTAMRFIKNPTENVKIAAVKKDGTVIRWIENPSETIKIAAVSENGWAIRYINNPSEEVQLAAVKESPVSVNYIKKPLESVQIAAVQQDGQVIEHIIQPSEAVQLAAVKQNGKAIYYLFHPSERVQLAAIEQNIQAFHQIREPSSAARSLYVRLQNSINKAK